MKSRASIEKIVFGDEPVFVTNTYTSTEFIQFINWYNYNVSHEQLKDYTITYFEGVLPEVVSTLETVPKTLIPKTLGTLCRMISRGYPSSEYILSKIDASLKGLLESTYEKELLKPVVEKKPVKVINKVDEYIGDIDGYLDNCISTHTFPKKDYPKYVASLPVTRKDKTEIAEYYIKLLTQLKQSEDEYGLSKQNFEKYVVAVEGIVSAFTNTIRKPRKVKPVDLDKLTAKVKYLAECLSLGLKSIRPRDIIGEKYVLLYDEKYRKLQLICAVDTLTIRGSTIYGVNKDISMSKIVKDPAIIANKFMKGGFEYVLGSFGLLKTKARTPNGSLNKNIIILRIIQ